MSGDSARDFKAPARFEIRHRLGSGGFGVVYEAYDRERQTVVALKELTRNDPAALYRFKREFRTLSDLVHPNLVTLYELISEQDQWLLAMELIRGVNFLDYVHDAQPFGAVPGFSSTPSASETAPTVASADPVDGAGRERSRRPTPFRADSLRSSLRQLVEGVRHLHQHGILHRDIKPSNVLVTTDGRVVLLDFGLATEFTADQRVDTLRIAGTPEYMSPEQAACKPLTEASDWYSVGVVLYLALTGQPPFSGSYLSMLMDKQLREPVPPHDLVGDLPDDLESLCRDLLRRDPEERASGADILRRLSGDVSAPVKSITSRSRKPHPFVGREHQLSVMREAYRAARGGKAVTLYLRGSSGMGKTALVRHFVNTVRESDDVVVLAGRCYEQEAVPYKALDSVVDALAEYLRGLPRAQAESLLPPGMWALARVFPVLQRVEAMIAMPRPIAEIRDSHELRRRASAALREMLGRLAERHPLVLFIDDLQWGDIDSASLLTDLLRPPDQPALLVIACYRAEEAESSPMLRTLLALQPEIATGEVKTLEVGELSPAEAGELVHSLAGDDHVFAKGRADLIARESGGHPFFIDQLVRYGQHDPTGTSLDSVLLGRAAGLPAASRALLEVTAVAGRPIDVAVANKAANLEAGDYGVISALRADQFVRTRVASTREIEPYHDRVRETIVASLAPDTLKRHHSCLAVALEESGRADPESLAVHFRGAGDAGKAAHYALAAAEQAAVALAFERAARLYRLALDLQPGEPSERRRLWVKLGDALANGGHVIEASQAYLMAAEGADASDRRELRRQAAEQFLMGGHLDQGLELLRSVLSGAGLPLPATSRRALLWIILRRPYMLWRGTTFRERPEREIPADDLWRVDLCHSAVRTLGFTETMLGIEFQMRHLLLALKVGEPYRVARALGFEAIADGRDRPTRRRAEELLARVRELIDRVPAAYKPDATANIHVTAGMLAFLAGRWKDASRELEQGEQLFREQSALRHDLGGLPYKLVVVQVYTLNALYYSGRLAEYFRRIPECLRESRDRGNAFAEANFRLQNSHRVCFGDDRPEGAQEEVQDALARWSPRGFLQIHAAELFHRSDFALYCGDARTAWEATRAGWPRLAASHLLRLQTIRIMALYVRARAALAMAAGSASSRHEFLEAAERDARTIERDQVPWGTPLTHLIRAGVAADRRDLDRARTWLGTAEAGFERADMALHAAVARAARGVVTGGDEGRALVAAADRWMMEHGVKNPARMRAMHAPGLLTLQK